MWKRVRIVAEVGTEFGIISDTDGELVVCAKPAKKKKWPHGIEPQAGRNTIGEGCNSYIVMMDEEKNESI
jgi:5-deoxy-D-glucuronate isomerase